MFPPPLLDDQTLGLPLLGEVTPACLALQDSLSLIIAVTGAGGRTRTSSQVAVGAKVVVEHQADNPVARWTENRAEEAGGQKIKISVTQRDMYKKQA